MADGTLGIVVMAVVTDTSVAFPPGSLTGFTSSRLVLYCTLEKNNCSQSKKVVFLLLLLFFVFVLHPIGGIPQGCYFWPNNCHLRVVMMVHLLLLIFDDPSQEALGPKNGI